nr:Arm DNA-binding domain-containing protein [Rodentibacter mrazii]
MSKIVKPLTNTTIQNLKAAEKEYIKSDGGGLYIRIKPNGAKIWYFAYK